MLCALARPAFAQPPAEPPTEGAPPGNRNPYTGQFVGSPADQRQMLDVRGSLFAGYDDNLTAAATGQQLGNTFDPQQQLQPGVGDGLDGSVAYRFRLGDSRTQFHVTGDAAIREFSSKLDPHGLWFKNFDVATGISTKLTPKITATLNGGAMYAPYYQYVPFLKDTATTDSPVGSDYGYALASDWVASTSVGASIVTNLSRRSAITADGSWSLFHVVGTSAATLPTTSSLTSGSASSDGASSAVSPTPLSGLASAPDMEMLYGHVGYSHNLTRKLVFHVGYGVQEARYANGQTPFVNHLLDIGVGYGDGVTLHFARYYTLSMNAGVGVAKNDDPALVLKTGKNTNFFVTGAATLSRSLGRTWGTSVGYNRGMSYIVGFAEPMITDTASTGIGGPIGERVFVSAGAGASRGTFAFSGGILTTYTGSARLSYALFRYMSMFAQASYYRYKIPPEQAVLGLVPELDRRSVMVGLSTWVPLLKPPRSKRDTR